MEKISDILSSIPSFSGLSETQIEGIRQIAVDRHFDKGEIIFFQGDKGNGFYVVVSSSHGVNSSLRSLSTPAVHFQPVLRPLPNVICCFYPERNSSN